MMGAIPNATSKTISKTMQQPNRVPAQSKGAAQGSKGPGLPMPQNPKIRPTGQAPINVQPPQATGRPPYQPIGVNNPPPAYNPVQPVPQAKGMAANPNVMPHPAAVKGGAAYMQPNQGTGFIPQQYQGKGPTQQPVPQGKGAAAPQGKGPAQISTQIAPGAPTTFGGLM